MNIPMLPKMKTLGTVSDLAEELETHTEDKLTEFKNKSNAEMECFEERGEGDQWSERKRIMAPKVKYLKRFRMRYCLVIVETMAHNIWVGIMGRYKKWFTKKRPRENKVGCRMIG